MRRLRSLRAKVLLAVLAIGVVFLASFWLLIVPFTERALHQSEAQLADVYATMVARNLGGDTARALVELERLAAQPAIATMQRDAADGVLNTFDATTTYFLHFALYNPDGVVVARPDKPERIGADRSTDPHVAETMRLRRTYVGPVRLSPGGNLAVTVGTLVRRDGQIVGVLSGSLGLPDRNPELYSDVLSPALPPSWIVTLTSAEGTIIARSNGALPARTIVALGAHPLLDAAQAARGAVEYVRDGRRWIGATHRIDALGWYVLVEVPREEIEQAVATTTQRVSAIGLIAIVSLVLIMLLLLERLTRRLGTLAVALDSYGAGVETPVAAGPPDEVGEALAAFNKMMTGRRLAEVQRDNSIAELKVRNAEMERFTYSVSHDLKSPLITIGSFARLAEEDLAAGNHERLRHDLRHIQDASKKMATLLAELLELSRVGRVVNPPSETPLAEIAAEVVAHAKAAPNASRIEIVIQPGLPTLMADRGRITEVIQNLVDNAVRFLGEQPCPRIEIGMRSGRGAPVFYVADNGIGIPPAFHDRIFDLFVRLNPASEGTGVGLALVRRIVEAHGGRVWVESDGENRGSTFCFTIGAAQ
jgi:signal transduction histidine kinase